MKAWAHEYMMPSSDSSSSTATLDSSSSSTPWDFVSSFSSSESLPWNCCLCCWNYNLSSSDLISFISSSYYYPLVFYLFFHRQLFEWRQTITVVAIIAIVIATITSFLDKVPIQFFNHEKRVTQQSAERRLQIIYIYIYIYTIQFVQKYEHL